MSAAAIVTRVSYSEGQLLTADDLTAEQAYLIEMRQRHAAGNHNWGIAHGLELTMQGATLCVGPGTAVDGSGRQLIVPDQVQTPTANLQGDELVAWLVYSVEPVRTAPAGKNSRSQEVTVLRLSPGLPGDPRQPDTTGTDWPVFLGVIRRPGAGKDFVVDTAAVRPYIGLVGETVEAASGAAQMRVGTDFAVALPTAGADPGEFSDRLRISPVGNLTVVANACFTGTLHLQPDAGLTPSGRVGAGFANAGAPPAAAAPWQIYSATVPRPGLPALNQLTIEVRGPEEKEDPAGLTAAMGTAGNGTFQPGLTVASNGDVTVEGTIRVGGQVIESPIPADPSDPRFLVALANASAGATTDAPGPLTVVMGAPDKNNVGAVTYTLNFANGSSAAIQVIQVQEFVTLNGELAPAPDQTIAGFSLDGSASLSIKRLLQVAEPGTLSIGVRVLGVGASGAALSAKDARQIQVTK